MKIYNLFPRLAGHFKDWTPHIERASRMGFDWIFVNPIQVLGQSRSLYSIADHFAINATFAAPETGRTAEEQVRAMVAEADRLGLGIMIDLVINHCAKDSRLVHAHPEWFVRDGNEVASAFCVESDGNRVVWHDLAQFDHRGSPDREGLLAYCIEMVEYLIDLGFRGFRCDAAYQIPRPVWEHLITHICKAHPDAVFVAETLGCSPEQTRETAAAGFDAIFNSSKWWDFEGGWLLEQYEQTRRLVPSISFPESHDTERLFHESGGNPNAMKQRYLFAALFSTGVMMPIGFEYGFKRRLDVVNTRPEDWEGTHLDLTAFIAEVNRIKDRFPVFRQEGPIERLHHPNPAILLLRKGSDTGRDTALLALNKDPWNQQHLRIDDICQVARSPDPLLDVSPESPMDQIPTPFELELGPGMGRVWVTPAISSEGDSIARQVSADDRAQVA
ncbi:alpha-amylase family glycosyl hydrolase [Thiocapsa roseopersicina]|uniref:Starch synthase (Maltosyl-transferring) n=1 Tax=Thiocapsa roseopersicina TaxID=1058 RepID=A0A1H2WVS0_THIRO|nr:alpha-amylase family glycosyl hydrolase [Thiocapsa roseopersicina]SDW84661.1 starch synthase (maltosyl-transferring) [Thiocapsa roseopersicina]